MQAIAPEETPVAGKKKGGTPKRYGTLIRVTDEFAEAIGEACSFEKKSVAEFATKYLLTVVRKHYKDAIIKKAKKMEEKG